MPRFIRLIGATPFLESYAWYINHRVRIARFDLNGTTERVDGGRNALRSISRASQPGTRRVNRFDV